MKYISLRICVASVMFLFNCVAAAQSPPPEGPILFTNVNVFDGGAVLLR